MSKTKKIAILAIIAMVLTLMPTALFAATADDTRLAGASRIATALEIASAGTWGTSVVLAPADDANLVDALAAAPLAGQENAPILLTFKGSLDAAVKAKIAAMGATKVYVVGAISDAVAAEVDAIANVTVEALKGAGRQATAAAVNAKLTSPAGTFVVGYDAIPDALSVASYAAKNKYKIVLANADGSVDSAALVGTKYIVGGATKVKDITGATRLSGADRFATNADVASKLGFSYDRVYVANGVSLVDALAVAPLAAKYNAFVVLASASDVASIAGVTATTKVIAVGGVNAVSDAVKAKVYVAPSVITVVSAEVESLSAIKVTFSQEADSTSATDVANYTFAGVALPANTKIILSADKKVATIQFEAKAVANQYGKGMFVVKPNVIFSNSKLQTAARFETELTFVDTTRPTVSEVAFDGNKTLNVKFSEPVRMTAGGLLGVPTTFKIDGLQLANYGFAGAVAVDPTTGANAYSKTLRITFNDAITAGAHTVTIPDGTVGALLDDEAGFNVSTVTVNATVSSVTTAPAVTSVVALTNGEITVTFDRAMSADALAIASYNVNDKGFGALSIPAPPADFKANTGKTVVVLNAAAGVVKEGINTIEVLNTVKDTFGNKINATTNYRTSFTATKDATKPEIKTLTVLSNGNIRVQYSETVANAYAIAAGNYDLRDSSNVRIAVVPARVGGTAAGSDTYDLAPASALTGDTYTLKFTGIVDMANPVNTMDTVTKTLTGSDSTRPILATGTPFVKVSANKLLVMFNEAMDAASLTNLSNIYFMRGSGANWVSLPSGTTLTASEDGKGVLITFPTAYTIDDTAPAAATDFDVVGIQISGAKDKTGNLLDTVTTTATTAGVAPNNFAAAAAANASLKSKYVTDSYKISESGDDVIVEFEVTKMLATNFTKADWTVNGVAADSGYISGKKVVLTFSTPINAAAIKALGKTVTLASAGTASQDVYNIPYDGASFAALTSAKTETATPKLTGIASAAGAAGAATATVSFNESIDQTLLGLSKSDFVFINTSTGEALTVKSIAAGAANTFVVTFNQAIVAGNMIRVKATETNNLKDLAGNLYAPKASDKDTGYAAAAV